MFIQVIQGRVADRDEMRDALESWLRELAPGAVGWLGTTAGVTAAGDFIGLVRFESADAAQRNSHRPEQHQWWMETAKLFAGDVVFHDCTEVDTLLAGGSDDAGFVQVAQGRTADTARMREINRQVEALMGDYRPEIIGGTTALHGNGTFTEAVYFTSEPEAREGERKEPPPELQPLFDEYQALVTDLRYYDLTDPWLYSPPR